MSNDERLIPRLENWQLILDHLHGEVYDDDRFPDGLRVRTSTVRELNEAEGYAQTRNTGTRN
jgi:hypothetical protein